MKFFFLISFSFLFTKADSQNLASQDILVNTFMIKTDTGTLTSFLIIKDGEEYLITARHGFRVKNKNKTNIQFKILYDSLFIPVTGTLYLHKDASIDIAAIKLSRNLSKVQPPAIANRGTFFVGQDCMFFGYPYGAFRTRVPEGNAPFVKKALISSINDREIFLDGINNPGFSGGPVLVYNLIEKKVTIIGVISGYYPEYNLITNSKKSKLDSLQYRLNSGIVISYRIDLIDELINPN